MRRPVAGVVEAALAISVAVSAAATGRAVHADTASGRAQPWPSERDPSNPLDLPRMPGSNPLNGAQFFVDGPRHGAAAGAIADMIGVSHDSFPERHSWARFRADISPGGQYYGRISGNRSLENDVQMLAKIADQPEAQRISAFVQGGGPGAIYNQTEKILCGNLSADPDTIPIFTTYSLPHAVVYAEAGYSDGNSAPYTARALNNSGIRKIRGFFTNDTHLNWTSDEAKWAESVSKETHGAHYIINPAQSGNGPERNPHPSTQGIEDLCNPPGRARGPQPTTQTGYAHADAYMWIHIPGNSSGCGGGPPAATFWAARAIELASHANGKLGPRSASHPY